MESSIHSVETILKVDCEGDMRRALLAGTPNYEAIERAVQEIWPHRSAREAKYEDDEGDACTLTEGTFTDFLCTAKKTATGGQSILRLRLAPAALASGYAADAERAPTADEAFSMPWQHVEQSSDAGDEGLHTVADLTDMQDEKDSVSQGAQVAPLAAELASLDQGLGHKMAKPVVEQGESAEPKVPGETSKQDSMLDEFLLADVQTDTGAPVEDSTVAEKQAAEESLQAASRLFEEQTDIVIAAFDQDGDGCLSFVEIAALTHATRGERMPQDVYEQMCIDGGADATVGLNRDALMCIYSCDNTWMFLQRDFEVAKRKLQGERPDQYSRQPPLNNPISLILRNPLLAAPFAVDMAERVRQGVASQIR